MLLPTIAIINFSRRSDQEVQDAIRAINRQVREDFMPLWGSGRSLKMKPSSFNPSDSDTPAKDPVEADSVIYLVDEASVEGALDYHDMNARETPVGFVFVLGDDWTVTLSHEVLEMILDPTVNIFIPGPDLRALDDDSRWLLHAYEACRAVERSAYEIDLIGVSNFVTPTYFRASDAPRTRNDFLGIGVESFGVTEGSQLGVIDPDTGEWFEIWGSETPNVTAFARRAKFFELRTTNRPKDTFLCDVLQKYNAKPGKGRKGLYRLSGISRTSRYKAAAERLKPVEVY